MMLSLESLGTMQELFQINFTVSIGISQSKELNKLVLVLQDSFIVNIEEVLATFDFFLGECAILVGVNHVKDLSISFSSTNAHVQTLLKSNGCQSKIIKWITNKNFLLSLLLLLGFFTIFTATAFE